MFNEDGTKAVVFNGEIYNFQELREELLAKRSSLRHKERYGNDPSCLRGVGGSLRRADGGHVRLRHMG